MYSQRRAAAVRARRPQRQRFPRVLYWVIGAGAIALSAGFAVGSLTFGAFGFSPHQAGASGVPASPPSGISFPLAEGILVSATSVPAEGACATSNLGTNVTPTALTNGSNTTICLSTHAGGFALGDIVYILDVSWNSTAPLSTVFEVQVYMGVVPTTNSFTATAYVKTSASITAFEGATLALDMTQTGDTGPTGFSVLVTQL